MPKAAGVLFEVDSESLGRSEAVANVPGPSRPAAHIKPGESSKATAERKRPAAAKRSLPHSSCSASTKRVSPAHISHPLSPTLSLALFISDKNSTGTILQIPSSTCSHLAHHPPPGPYVINPPSASSSPSASIVFAFHRCHHQIVPAAFGCRLYPGHQHQRHRFWCSILQHYFVWLASCQTLDLVGGLCNARGVGHRRLSQTPWPCLQ